MKPSNPPLPGTPFALVLVEGGDEVRLCQAVLPLAPQRPLVCWNARGRDIPSLAAVAAKDPNWLIATHVGIILDAEEDPTASLALGHAALAKLGVAATPPHAQLVPGPPTAGVFVLPDGATARGAGEGLLRRAAANAALASCADAFEQCAAVTPGTTANRDKSWIQSYLAHSGDGGLRVHDAVAGGGWFDLAHPTLNPFRTFVGALVS